LIKSLLIDSRKVQNKGVLMVFAPRSRQDCESRNQDKGAGDGGSPKVEGRFVLELSLIQEQMCWLEEMGFQSLRLKVEVMT
jgi:hypothetical protein